jgi:hypothetical protein
MRLITLVAVLCLSIPVWADEWTYDGPIRIINPGDNKGVEITEAEHKQSLDQHKVVRDLYKGKRNRPTRFPVWFSSK